MAIMRSKKSRRTSRPISHVKFAIEEVINGYLATFGDPDNPATYSDQFVSQDPQDLKDILATQLEIRIDEILGLNEPEQDKCDDCPLSEF